MVTPESENVRKIYDLPMTISQCTPEASILSPDDYGPFVTVVVGTENERKFYVYKGLLEHHSSYFRRALQEVWQEGAPCKVELTEDDPEVFRVFFHWLTTGKLYQKPSDDKSIPMESRFIWELYVFGDARGAPEFRNAVINVMYQKLCQTWAFPKDVTYIYENTIPGSMLRKAAVKFATDAWSFEDLANPTEETLEKYPKEFLANVITELLAMRVRPVNKAQWIQQTRGQVCRLWHDHTTAREGKDSAK